MIGHSVILSQNPLLSIPQFEISARVLRTGRIEGIDAAHRYCPFRVDMVESEAHMLLVCPIYNEGRSRVFGIIDANYHEFSSSI